MIEKRNPFPDKINIVHLTVFIVQKNITNKSRIIQLCLWFVLNFYFDIYHIQFAIL